MDAKRSVKRQVYIIPENYIDESRAINGMFKTRNLIEAVILACFAMLISLRLPTSEITTKITLAVIFGVPAFILGVTGIGGDPLSVAIATFFRWARDKGVMLYDSKPRILTQTPLNKMMNRTLPKDQLLELYGRYKKSRLEKHLLQDYVEGENFVFEPDKTNYREYITLETPTVVEETEDDIFILEPGDSNFAPVLNIPEPRLFNTEQDLSHLDYTTEPELLIDDAGNAYLMASVAEFEEIILQ